MEELRVERDQKNLIDAQWRRQLFKIQEMRAFQQTVQAYTHTTASPLRTSVKTVPKSNNHTASTSESTKQELVPSFLKALYITSEDTIFDDDCEAGLLATTGNSILALKSLTNSAEGALSAPEALKQRMAEINRSKSALATSNTKSATSANDVSKQINLQKANYQNFMDQKFSRSSNQQPNSFSKGQVQNRQNVQNLSQTQKYSMKSARDSRPSSNLGFNQSSEQKQPRDRSQQNLQQTDKSQQK